MGVEPVSVAMLPFRACAVGGRGLKGGGRLASSSEQAWVLCCLLPDALYKCCTNELR